MLKNIKTIFILIIITQILWGLNILLFAKNPYHKEDTLNDLKFSYRIDSSFIIFNQFNLTKEEQSNLKKEIKKLTFYENDVQLLFKGDYQIEFEDAIILFDNNNDDFGLYKKDERSYIINIKKLKEKALEIDKKHTREHVLLYERPNLESSSAIKRNLTEEEKNTLELLFNNQDKKEIPPMNLMVAGRYILFVNDEAIYFDDLSGYAIYNNKMILLNQNFRSYLKEIISTQECCSCCEKEETCIAMCCPCN